MGEQRDFILRQLEPLFRRAERDGLHFYHRYTRLYFSPEELREEHKNGKYVWGVINWELRKKPEEGI